MVHYSLAHFVADLSTPTESSGFLLVVISLSWQNESRFLSLASDSIAFFVPVVLVEGHTPLRTHTACQRTCSGELDVKRLKRRISRMLFETVSTIERSLTGRPLSLNLRDMTYMLLGAGTFL
jgi:hypothetical protein